MADTGLLDQLLSNIARSPDYTLHRVCVGSE
jgi:hypothetical protein